MGMMASLLNETVTICTNFQNPFNRRLPLESLKKIGDRNCSREVVQRVRTDKLGWMDDGRRVIIIALPVHSASGKLKNQFSCLRLPGQTYDTNF